MTLDASKKNVEALTNMMNSGSTLVSIVKQMLKTMEDGEIRQQLHEAVSKYDDSFEILFTAMILDDPK